MEDDITRKVKIEAPTFDGTYDPQFFSDWLANIDDYFDWYDIDDEHKVKYAGINLQRSAKIYWMSIERVC